MGFESRTARNIDIVIPTVSRKVFDFFGEDEPGFSFWRTSPSSLGLFGITRAVISADLARRVADILIDAPDDVAEELLPIYHQMAQAHEAMTGRGIFDAAEREILGTMNNHNE